MKETPNTLSPKPTLVLLGSLLLLAACGGGGGGNTDPDPQAAGDKSVAARTTVLTANDSDCPQGGILVESGIDENGNGLLDDNEVDSAEKVCNGADGSNGLNALAVINGEPAGAQCAAGGLRVDSGLDANGNGTLESSEISTTKYLCHGQSGSDGLNSLIAFSDEPPGANCPWGGTKIDSGLDVNGNGSLDSSEIDQTRFLCSLVDGDIGWQVAEQIDAGNEFASYPQIAVAADGSAIAVWRQQDGTANSIYANRYDPATGWGTAEPIEAGSGDADSPQIAVAADGSAIAVWRQQDGTTYSIYANRFDGSSWGTAGPIEINSGSAYSPQIALADDGSAIAVWRQEYSVYANRYLPGSGWSITTTEIDDAGSGFAQSPRIAVATDGSAIAVWEQYDGTEWSIYANHYDPATGWDTAVLIETDSGEAYSPQIAVAADGSAIAVWRQSDGTASSIYANRFDGSHWGSAGPIETGSEDAYSPQIAVADDGSAIAVWRQWDGTASSIYANRFDGSNWGLAKLIETGRGDATEPRIALADDGSALALWAQDDGSRYNLNANRFLPGAGWGLARLVEHDDAGGAVSPGIGFGGYGLSLGFDGNGNALAVWAQDDGTRWNVWANRWLAP